MKQKYLFLFAVFLCFLVLIITARILLVPQQAEIPYLLTQFPETKMTAALKEIFNELERNNWISSISQIEYDMVLIYNFKPPDTGNLEDTLGMNISPKIKVFMKDEPFSVIPRFLMCSRSHSLKGIKKPLWSRPTP